MVSGGEFNLHSSFGLTLATSGDPGSNDLAQAIGNWRKLPWSLHRPQAANGCPNQRAGDAAWGGRAPGGSGAAWVLPLGTALVAGAFLPITIGEAMIAIFIHKTIADWSK